MTLHTYVPFPKSWQVHKQFGSILLVHRLHVAALLLILNFLFLDCLLFPALPKVHSDAQSGPLNVPQSLVIMLAMLNFFILLLQQCTFICAHSCPFQHTSPTYIIRFGMVWTVAVPTRPSFRPARHVDEKAAQLHCGLGVFMPSSMPSYCPLLLASSSLRGMAGFVLKCYLDILITKTLDLCLFYLCPFVMYF